MLLERSPDMKQGTVAPLISAFALCLIALLAFGVSSACSPVAQEDNKHNGERTNTEVRFELCLASDQPVNGWDRRVIRANQREIYVSREVHVTNTDIAKAWLQQRGEGFAVGLYLTEEGAIKLAKVSGENTGKKLAILVDGEVVSAPRVMAQISDRAEIHGNFTEQEARDLAAALNPSQDND
jgi:preprotein translocase subunit SecD